MGRNRVLSFMSQFSGGVRDPKPPTPSPSPTREHDDKLRIQTTGLGQNNSNGSGSTVSYISQSAEQAVQENPPTYPQPPLTPTSPARSAPEYSSSPNASPIYSGSPVGGGGHGHSRSLSQGQARTNGHQRTSSRPLSMVQTYQPPLMDINEDTIPELLPIFTFLNSHANKLYQEGYFLKLDDQNTHGRPNPDRTWSECFAQLVGTVLSLWDAAELDAAGEDGEVLPKFINLTDASIKMIESLPTRTKDEQPLQNILSISTAGRNRYLLHFNSHHSLIQWTAGIRLAMYEHSTLQEAYTGALIAGKGKSVNNINIIMERARFKTEEWVRVRFGAGVPWRRCWCVITPPDEKEYQKVMKEHKKRSPYDRSQPPILKGDIKFYDTKVEGKKQKKVTPIASITDSYSAYAIYPQAKSLIDASTLLKIEGNITIHSDPPSSTEGFVFIMPEVHPMVSGFEMLLRFLFPTWDTFGLYGRPGRLVASVLDPRSLMFAMPKHRRYGYLEILDVTGLILTEGSSTWTEREWRKQLKTLTGTRMNTMDDASESPKSHSRSGSRKSNCLSFGGSGSPGQQKPRIGFADEESGGRPGRSLSLTGDHRGDDSAPPVIEQDSFHRQQSPGPPYHHQQQQQPPYRQQQHQYGNMGAQRPPPMAPPHLRRPDGGFSDDEQLYSPGGQPPPLDGMRNLQTPEPVSRPPAFNHGPQSRPSGKPYHSPELRRANSRLSNTTLSQLAKAGGVAIPAEGSPAVYPDGGRAQDNSATAYAHPSVQPHANPYGITANDAGSREAMTPPNAPAGPPPSGLHAAAVPALSQQRSRSPMAPPHQQGFRSTPSPGPGQRNPQPASQFPGGPQQGAPGQGPQPPFNNFSRPDGARTPPVVGAGPGRVPTPEMRGRGQPGPPPDAPLPNPQFGRDQRPRTPTAADPQQQQPGARGMPLHGIETSPPIHRKPVGGGGAPHDNAHVQRQTSGRSAGSHYDDVSSTTSPDYASTRKSSETQESTDRPRAGVLKTVGGEPPMPPAPNLDDYNVPSVNFGPTVNYGASPRRKTPTPVHPGMQEPGSPAVRSAAVEDSNDNGPRRAPWQPGGSAIGGGGASQPISAEQYVQQRAAYGGHVRTPSSNALNTMRSMTPSPSMGRRSSQELLGRHHRNSSGDLLQRPNSRGPNQFFDVGSSGEMASHLSAREQEQVARMTGSPLINMAGGGRPQQAPGAGLVGAIEARERDRMQMKQGVNSQAVQHAIQQRQQQHYQQQMYGQQQQPPPMSPQNSGRGGNGQFGSPRMQQQGFGGPPPQQGPGCRGPGMGQMQMPMRQSPQSPGGFMPPQGQYAGAGRPQSPAGQYGPGPGRGQPGIRPPYQGQAF